VAYGFVVVPGLLLNPSGEATLSHAAFEAVTWVAPRDSSASMLANATTAAMTAKTLSGKAQDSLPSV